MMLNKILIGIFIAIFFAAIIYIPKTMRVYNVVHLFDEDKIVKNFINIEGSISMAVNNFVRDVKNKKFPLSKHSYK